jgi:hypothetical protein
MPKLNAMLTFLREWWWRCFVGWVGFHLRRRASSAARSAAFGPEGAELRKAAKGLKWR